LVLEWGYWGWERLCWWRCELIKKTRNSRWMRNCCSSAKPVSWNLDFSLWYFFLIYMASFLFSINIQWKYFDNFENGHHNFWLSSFSLMGKNASLLIYLVQIIVQTKPCSFSFRLKINSRSSCSVYIQGDGTTAKQKQK
jgi:hypothetical protein